MNSPLKYDENIVKEFGIKAEQELEPELKLGYVRAQISELKTTLWRERVEIQMAESQVAEWAKKGVDEMISETQKKVAAHRTAIKGMLRSLTVLNEFESELESKITK